MRILLAGKDDSLVEGQDAGLSPDRTMHDGGHYMNPVHSHLPIQAMQISLNAAYPRRVTYG